MKGSMYRRAYWPNEGTKTSPKTYSPTPEGYKKSIDPDHVDQEGRTALHLALLNGGDDDDNLERVIKAKCDVNTGDKDGHRGVHYAAERGYTRCIQKLTKHGAELSVLDDCGYSPLMLAARHDFPKTIRALIRAGANPNQENDKQELALHYAVYKGHLECVQDLVAAKTRLDQPDVEGTTALMVATKFRHFDVMRALISAGVKLNKADRLGKTALHWAAAIGCLQLLQLLVQAGVEIDVFDKYGHSPFVYTIQTNHYSALRYLLEVGCDRNTVDGLNGTALGLACIKGHNECTEILLDTGDDPDERGFFGLTPLMSASFEGHVDVVKTLLDHGANPNMPGRMGATPLIKALITICPRNEAKRHQIVAMLIRAGADVNVRATAAGYFTCITNGRNCPLSFAMCSGYTSLVQMLLLAGSKVLCSEIKAWYSDGENTDSFYDKNSIMQPIKNWKHSTRPLKYICRTVIRDSIDNRNFNKSNDIKTLPIAPVLQKYVDYSDLDEIEPERAEMSPDQQLLQTQQYSLRCSSAHRVLEGTLLLQTLT